MMKYLMVFLVVLLGFGFAQVPPSEPTRKSTISTGERLDYRMYLGIFTVGRGITTVDANYHTRNSKQCYKVDAFMETLGVATWVSKVNDNWGAYVDTSELL